MDVCLAESYGITVFLMPLGWEEIVPAATGANELIASDSKPAQQQLESVLQKQGCFGSGAGSASGRGEVVERPPGLDRLNSVESCVAGLKESGDRTTVQG